MSISDKLATIAENIPKVYNAGKSQGYDEGYNAGKGESNYEEAYDAGQQAEYDRFWDAYQSSGSAKNYVYAFAGQCWTDKTYNPKYPIVVRDNASNLFAYSKMTDTKVDVNLTRSGVTVSGVFSNSKLITIKKVIVSENTKALTSAFTSCADLENLTFEGIFAKNITLSDCTKLTLDSLKSVINSLSDSASSVSATFSETAVNNAFETSEGASDGSTSPEWLALVATKPNWTISLV